MGYFSWLTADTQKSIRVHKNKDVYLLQPNGKEPIHEDWYDGSGCFGDTDAYAWFAQNNVSSKILAEIKADRIAKGKNDYLNVVRSLGVSLDPTVGKPRIYRDVDTGVLYCYNWVLKYLDKKIKLFEGNFGTIQAEHGYDKTPNELIESKQWVLHELDFKVIYPLKFSFDKNAKYEELPASKICPNQGYF